MSIHLYMHEKSWKKWRFFQDNPLKAVEKDRPLWESLLELLITLYIGDCGKPTVSPIQGNQTSEKRRYHAPKNEFCTGCEKQRR